jgi:hypothetical protein
MEVTEECKLITVLLFSFSITFLVHPSYVQHFVSKYIQYVFSPHRLRWSFVSV